MDQTGGGEDPTLLLSDRVLVNGTVTAVTLTVDGIVRWTEGGSHRCLEVDKEVLGFSTEGSRIKIRAVVGGGNMCCVGSRGAPVRKTFAFEPLSEDLLRLWCQKLQEFIDSLGRPKRLFIFVNPFGGKKSASKIFLDDVKPLLEDVNVEFTLQGLVAVVGIESEKYRWMGSARLDFYVVLHPDRRRSFYIPQSLATITAVVVRNRTLAGSLSYPFLVFVLDFFNLLTTWIVSLRFVQQAYLQVPS